MAAKAQHLYDFDNVLKEWEKNLIQEKIIKFSLDVEADAVVLIYSDPSVDTFKMSKLAFRTFQKYNLGMDPDTNIVCVSMNVSTGQGLANAYGSQKLKDIYNNYNDCLNNCMMLGIGDNNCTDIIAYFDAFRQLYLQKPGDDGLGFYQNNIRALIPDKTDEEVYDLTGFASYDAKSKLGDYDYYRTINRNRVFYRIVLLAYPCHLSSSQISDTLALLVRKQEQRYVDFTFRDIMQKSHVMIGINIFDLESGIIHGGLIQDYPPSQSLADKLNSDIKTIQWTTAIQMFKTAYDSNLDENQAYQDLLKANVSTDDDEHLPLIAVIILVAILDAIILMLLTLVLTAVFGIGTTVKDASQAEKPEAPALEAGISPRGKAAAMHVDGHTVRIEKDMSYLKDKQTNVQ